jgi:rubrerythrin
MAHCARVVWRAIGVAEHVILSSVRLAPNAARFAELNGIISASTEENLEKTPSGETGTNKAKKAGVDEPRDHFDGSLRDEARHNRALQGLLNRYFG